MRLRTFSSVPVLLLGAAGFPQDVTFKANVKLVEVYATVFDHAGHAIDGLTKEQFQLLDDGKPQAIRIFEPTSESISCALLLDTTSSMQAVLPESLNATRNFIRELRPGDSASLYAFNERLTELQEMTVDKAALNRALTRLRAGGRTALFDSVAQLAHQFEKRPGKKAIVALTDGGDNASVLNRESAARRARKAGVPVFAVAEGDALKDEASARLLRELAEATGGHMYKAKESKDLKRIFEEISRDLQNGYLLAFEPQNDASEESWHDLQVLVRDVGSPVRIRARTGYNTQ
jgi:Ca-activated chloride channel homolog